MSINNNMNLENHIKTGKSVKSIFYVKKCPLPAIQKIDSCYSLKTSFKVSCIFDSKDDNNFILTY